MKALARDKSQRYPTVTELTLDVVAYQGGFATSAENADALTLVRLFIRRNRVLASAAALVLLVILIALPLVLASERKARANALAAEESARVARQHEAEAKVATAAAVKGQAAARLSAAQAHLALAEAAQREGNGIEMQAALGEVPEELRDSTWHYPLAQSDTSIARSRAATTREIVSVAADPLRPSVFALVDGSGRVALLNVLTGVRHLEFNPGLKQAGSGLRLAFSPDGTRLAIGRSGTEGGIAIHSAKDGTKLTEWAAPSTKQLEFSPDGQTVLQMEGRGSNITPRGIALKVWDAATGQLRWEQGDVALAAFTPDGKQVLTHHTASSRFRLLNARDGQPVRGFDSGRQLTVFGFSPDGKRLATSVRGSTIQVVNAEDGSVLFEFPTQECVVRRLDFTPDGTRILRVGELKDGRQAIQLWDAKTAAPLQMLLGGSGRVADMAMHPLSGELVVAGPTSRTWSLHAVPAKYSLRSLNQPVAFWGSDDLLCASASGPKCALLNLQSGSPTMLWEPRETLTHPTVSADGQTAAIGLPTGSQLTVLRRTGHSVTQVAAFHARFNFQNLRLSPNGDRLAVTGRGAGALEVHDTRAGDVPVKFEIGEKRKFWDVAWLGPQRLVALVTAKVNRGLPGSEEQIVLWDTTTGRQVATASHRTAMNALAIAPDGRRFAEAGADKRVRLRDAATLAVQQEFRAHDDAITALAWHPTQPILATASADLTVKLWHLDTGQRLEELRGMLVQPTSLAFSPTGRRLACVSHNDAVRIWEPTSLNAPSAAAK